MKPILLASQSPRRKQLMELLPWEFKVYTKSVNEVIDENMTQLEAYKVNPKLFDYFIGQTMKKTKGKANPALTAKILKIELEKR